MDDSGPGKGRRRAGPAATADDVGSPGAEHRRPIHGQPVVKPPVWTPEIPVYLFTGGICGVALPLAALSEPPLAKRAAAVAWVTLMERRTKHSHGALLKLQAGCSSAGRSSAPACVRPRPPGD